MESLNFDLKREERPVVIDGEPYVLVELDGRGRDLYLNNLGGRLRHGTDGKPGGVENFEGLQASLVAASLKKVCSDGRKDVAVETIQTWPARVVDGLFDAAKELSALNEEEEDENEKSKENDENDEAESEKND